MQDKVELTSMVRVIEKARKEGYTLDFRVSEDEFLCSMDGKLRFTPDQVRIVNFYRFEGETYPADMAILYVIEAKTGEKGTISDAYGPYADDKVENFMKQVEDLGKNLDKHNLDSKNKSKGGFPWF